MKLIKREDLQKEYAVVTESDNFDEKYVAHGTMTECNHGGLLITLDKNGESCVVVRDWGGEEILISDVLEVESQISEEDEEESEFGFTFNETFYSLSDFMRI